MWQLTAADEVKRSVSPSLTSTEWNSSPTIRKPDCVAFLGRRRVCAKVVPFAAAKVGGSMSVEE